MRIRKSDDDDDDDDDDGRWIDATIISQLNMFKLLSFFLYLSLDVSRSSVVSWCMPFLRTQRTLNVFLCGLVLCKTANLTIVTFAFPHFFLLQIRIYCIASPYTRA